MDRLFRDNRGAQQVEMALVIVPLLGFIFVLMDVSWAVFVKASLQHAVREGTRYAITGQVNGESGQIDSIRAVVQHNAMGLLDGSESSKIVVRLAPMDTLAVGNDNSGGNLVMVSVENYRFIPLAPLLHAGAEVLLTVRAGDRIEPSPGGTPPRL